MDDGVFDPPKMLELTNHGLALPCPLEGFIGMLPLAPSANRGVSARWNPTSFDRFEDIDERDACPRALVLEDCPRDNLAWHCSGDEVRFSVLAGNGFATVCHVMWMQFNHGASVQRNQAIPDAVAGRT